MRVPNISKYNQATYQLNAISGELMAANQEESTGKRINEASDDPSGACMVMDINSSLSSMDQTLDNLLQGQTILLQAETTLNASADAIIDTKLLCSQMAGASASPQDRADAAGNLDTTIDMMLDLANTQVNGVYIFGGTANDCPPFAYDDPDNPTAVVYQGNEAPMCIKTGPSTTMELDCLGSDIFYEDEIIVDGTNNEVVFREDPGTGDADILIVETEIPYGTYTREELAAAVEDAMNQASAESGHGVEYEVSHDAETDRFSLEQDKAYSIPVDVTLVVEPKETVRLSSFETNGFAAPPGEVTVNTPEALALMTPSPEGSEPLTLTLNGDGNWEVENDPGYGIGPEIASTGQILELDMDGNGTPDITMDLGEAPDPGDSVSFDIVPGSENNTIGPDMGFDHNTAVADPARSQVPVSGPVTVTPGENDTIDFVETPEKGSPSSLTATVEPGTYETEEEYARAVEKALEKESAENGNRVNYEVAYDEASQTYVVT
ncbi:MAG: flagellar hook-associated protein 3, partial [Desulfobacterales bacterium]|nr:flagellar hook-associated protein 3 [Desulfobacterales bacterium]